MRGRLLALLVACAAVLLAPTVALAAESVDRTISDERITESSGLAFSPRHEDVLYTHNDSDDGPRLFAIAPEGGTAAVLTLRGAEARDWEAISSGKDGTNTLWVGDIGDNLAAWPSVRAYKVAEPRDLRTQDVDWTQYDLTYPDGPQNAESLMVHPVTGRLYVVTKDVMGGALYEAPTTLSTTAPNELRRVAKALAFATDAAFSPDGEHYVVRGYVNAVVYATDEPGTKVATVDLPAQSQGESIAWSPDGQSFLVGSEGSGSEIVRVDVPAEVLAAGGTASPTASSTTTDPDPADGGVGPTVGDVGGDDGGGGFPRAQVLWLGAAAVVLIALGLSLRAWGRRDPDEA